MSQVAVFFSTIPSCQMITPWGKYLYFINGRFTTDQSKEIDYLMDEISQGHPHIYQKKGEEVMEKENLDPITALKNKFIAEYLAEQARATNPDNDMGSSEQQKLVPTSSRDIAAAAAMSASGAAVPGVVGEGGTPTPAGGAKAIDLSKLTALKKS